MVVLNIPLEDIIDQWLFAQGIDVLWDDEHIMDYGYELTLDLYLKNGVDQISLVNKSVYDSVDEFLENYSVETR